MFHPSIIHSITTMPGQITNNYHYRWSQQASSPSIIDFYNGRDLAMAVYITIVPIDAGQFSHRSISIFSRLSPLFIILFTRTLHRSINYSAQQNPELFFVSFQPREIYLFFTVKEVVFPPLETHTCGSWLRGSIEFCFGDGWQE